MNDPGRNSGAKEEIDVHDVIARTGAEGGPVPRKWGGDLHPDLSATAEGNMA